MPQIAKILAQDHRLNDARFATLFAELEAVKREIAALPRALADALDERDLLQEQR